MPSALLPPAPGQGARPFPPPPGLLSPRLALRLATSWLTTSRLLPESLRPSPGGLSATQLCLSPTGLPDGCQGTLSRKAWPGVEFPGPRCSVRCPSLPGGRPGWATPFAVPILTACTLGRTGAFPAPHLCSPSSAASPSSWSKSCSSFWSQLRWQYFIIFFMGE